MGATDHNLNSRGHRRRVWLLLARVVVLNGLGLLACAAFGAVLFLFWRQMQVGVETSSAQRLIGLVLLFGPFAVFWILAVLAAGKLWRVIRMLRYTRHRQYR